MTRLVLNALHLNTTLQRGSPISIQTLKTKQHPKWDQIWKTIQTKTKWKNNIQIKTKYKNNIQTKTKYKNDIQTKTKYKNNIQNKTKYKKLPKLRLVSFQETSFSSSQPVTRSLSSVGRKQPTSSSRLPVLGEFFIYRFCLNVCQFLVSFFFFLPILSNSLPVLGKFFFD